MYKVLFELMPVNVQDENFCHDGRIEWLKRIEWIKRIDWMKWID
jgi:hypothetical protein